MTGRLAFPILVVVMVSAAAQPQQRPTPTVPEQTPPSQEGAQPQETEVMPRIPALDPPGPVGPPPPDFRYHFALRDPATKTNHYEATMIVRVSDEKHESILLVDDLALGTYILETVEVFKDHLVTVALTDGKRKNSVKSTFQLPYTAKTRTAVHTEVEANPSLLGLTTEMKLTTAGGEWHTSDAEWGDWTRIRELRRSIRMSTDPYLIEGADRMRGTIFASPAGDTFYSPLGRYLIYAPDGGMALELEEVQLEPACDFDKRFGYPCSEKQLERIKKANEDGKPLHRY